jgi:predicted metalloprotease with PDZ domain
MPFYKISSPEPQSRLLQIEAHFVLSKSQTSLTIQLPAWRPGRYELQHFAKNIQSFEVFDENGQALVFQKIKKDRWQIQTKGSLCVVKLNYYANVQNAGSSYTDAHTLYVNPVNCLPYAEDRLHEACTLELDIPAHWQVACGLRYNSTERRLMANSYYQLADSPLLASPFLQHGSYRVQDTVFHVWFLGNYEPNWPKILADFEAFSQIQIQTMGDFPEAEYHFINWILPTAFYHGVEHAHSTMIALGPDHQPDELYPDLLGVSSHELFHAWNICKIRPVEMMPYDFTQENYFPTGFVAEGITTYYGDVFLKRAGVFSLEQYLKELETVFKRHFENDGRAFQSLVESSFDLWLDGYTQAIPNRRVSIYQKGALVALILDLSIRLKHGHSRSLDDVMRLLWQRHGKTSVGYSLSDYRSIAEEVMGEPLDWYFEQCIEGNEPLERLLNDIIEQVGLQLQINEEGKYSLKLLDNKPHLEHWLGQRDESKDVVL